MEYFEGIGPFEQAIRLIQSLVKNYPLSRMVQRMIDDEDYRREVWDKVQPEERQAVQTMLAARTFLDKWEMSL